MKSYNHSNINIGDIYYAELPKHSYSSRVIEKTRPVLVIACNPDYSVVTVIPLTSNLKRISIPNSVLLSTRGKLGIALCNSIMTIDKKILLSKIDTASSKTLVEIKLAIMKQFCISESLLKYHCIPEKT